MTNGWYLVIMWVYSLHIMVTITLKHGWNHIGNRSDNWRLQNIRN